MAAPPLRFGILGAARIAPMALVKPARRVPEVAVLAVAARDPERARRFAARHSIPRVHQSYDALLANRRSTRSTTRSPTRCTHRGPSDHPRARGGWKRSTGATTALGPRYHW